MARPLVDVNWSDVTESAAATTTVIAIPLTSSIADGIGLGFLTYVLIKNADELQVRELGSLWIGHGAAGLSLGPPEVAAVSGIGPALLPVAYVDLPDQYWRDTSLITAATRFLSAAHSHAFSPLTLYCHPRRGRPPAEIGGRTRTPKLGPTRKAACPSRASERDPCLKRMGGMWSAKSARNALKCGAQAP